MGPSRLNTNPIDPPAVASPVEHARAARASATTATTTPAPGNGHVDDDDRSGHDDERDDDR
jgi:hypothetical protein